MTPAQNAAQERIYDLFKKHWGATDWIVQLVSEYPDVTDDKLQQLHNELDFSTGKRKDGTTNEVISVPGFTSAELDELYSAINRATTGPYVLVGNSEIMAGSVEDRTAIVIAETHLMHGQNEAQFTADADMLARCATAAPRLMAELARTKENRDYFMGKWETAEDQRDKLRDALHFMMNAFTVDELASSPEAVTRANEALRESYE